MESHLERFEFESFIARDDYLAIEHAALGELRFQRIDQLGEVSIERLLISALDENLIAISEDERAKAVPFGLENPCFAGRELPDSLREHRENWRIDGEVHQGMIRRS